MKLHEITGESFEEINSVFDPEHIRCTSRTVPIEAWRGGYPLRPASVYALEMKTV
ncbi:hypothetical protein JCM10914A_44780 [Paenibacillus sp. JCM 10914]|uniref:hypothetical protein n=1 Tax=Paenibacillus sp. JCM 10914 TaxID=1236974 RepID=UPI0003CCB449|nr:hypothetical protein [Paenibacillus sp. JCM 10914]GAE07518.1 hypothetical protein JCM10914_3750 [Paenibacillus sp. JCM 10914]